MSAEGQAITLLRTRDAHLSKAFEDEWEQLGANEYHDNAEGIAHSARIRVTAKEVCDEAGTGVFYVTTQVMATVLHITNNMNKSFQTRLGQSPHGDGTHGTSRQGSVGEIPRIVEECKRNLQKFLGAQ